MHVAAILRSRWAALVLLVCILWPPLAAAQYSGYYLELSGGPSATELEFLPQFSNTSRASEFEANSEMFALNFGLRFNDNISVEFGYADFGSFSDTATLTDSATFVSQDPATGEPVFLDGDVFISVDGEYQGSSISASVIGSWPVGRRWSVYGELGLSAWEVESSFTGTQTFTGETNRLSLISADLSDRGTGVFYSAGLLYRFNLSWGVRLEYQLLQFESAIFSSDAEIRGTNIGLRWYF